MVDENIVEEGAVSEGTVSPEASPEGEVTEQPLTKEDVQKMIDGERVIAKEEGKREMQSRKDVEVAEAQRRARYAEDSLARVRGKYTELDPEARQSLENEELKGELAYRRQRDATSQAETQYAEYTRALNESLYAHLEDLGIDPKDSRIDWGTNESDFVKGRARFDASVSKIIKAATKGKEEKMGQDMKDLEQRLRKDLGIDSVDTSVSVGTSKGIPTNMTTFRTWVQGLTAKEYAEKENDIDEMLAKGQIK